jgi:Domain of unknown function (DUF5753)
MEFTSIKPVVYLEAETSTVSLEESEKIESYRHILAALADTSLDAEQSKDLIHNLAHKQLHDRQRQLRRGRQHPDIGPCR